MSKIGTDKEAKCNMDSSNFVEVGVLEIISNSYL